MACNCRDQFFCYRLEHDSNRIALTVWVSTRFVSLFCFTLYWIRLWIMINDLKSYCFSSKITPKFCYKQLFSFTRSWLLIANNFLRSNHLIISNFFSFSSNLLWLIFLINITFLFSQFLFTLFYLRTTCVILFILE